MNLSRLGFSLIMCAGIFPMLALDKLPDPLSGTAWSALTAGNSAVIPFVLALAYAGASYIYMRKRVLDRTRKYWLGVVVGLIPGTFYLIISPFSTSSPPVAAMFAIGIISGAVLGGPGLMLFCGNSKRE